jgi:hypothetical protein
MWTIRGLNPDRSKRLLSAPKASRSGYGVYPKWKLAPGINWPRRVAHRSPPFGFEFKNEWNHSSTPPPYAFMECSETNFLLHEMDLVKGI